MTVHRTWRVFRMVAGFALVSGGLTFSGPGQAVFAWELDEPIVTYWGGWSMGPTVAEYVADGNINLIWTSEADGFGRNFLDLAEQNGINGLWMDAAFNENYQLGDLNDPVKKAYIDDTIDDLNEMVSTGGVMVPKYPAFFGYYLYDEPTADKFPQIAEIRDYLRVRDPEHLAYVNLSGLPGWRVTSQQQVDDYQAYLDDFISTVQPDLLSYDNFPFHNNFSGSTYVGKSDLNGYLANLGIISDTAQQAGIPFMNIVQAVRDNAGWRNPDSNELRYQVYSTLAYGAQGISYYNWYRSYTPPGPGEPFYNGDTTAGGLQPLSPGDVPTATYTALTPLNAQFVEIASELQRVERIGTYLKGYAPGSGPPGPTLPPGGAPFSISGVSDSVVYVDYDSLQGVLLGFFGTDSASLASSTTTLVQNIDYTNSRAFTVHGPANLSLFDATTGVWTPMGQTSIALNLAPGDGVLVGITPGPGRSWDIDGSGDWNDAANWIGEINSNGGVVPNGNTAITTLGSAITSPQTLFTNVPVTVKTLQFGDANDGGVIQAYAIAGAGSVNMEADAGNATIDVIDGAHQFQTVVNLNTTTDVSVATGAFLSFNNVLNLNGFNLTKTGGGTMVLNNALNTGGGMISAAAGVVSGSGMLLGDLENTGATLAPGDSPGQFTIQGDYTHGADATLAIEIAGLTQAAEYDLLTVGGNLTLEGGELLVELLDGFDPAAGDVFDILDSSAIGGVGFDSLNLPALAAGLAWDTSTLMTDGSLSISAVPEPAAAVLLGLALVGLVGMRQPFSSGCDNFCIKG